jgi:putative ATP-dependent endonuclease of OLD family
MRLLRLGIRNYRNFRHVDCGLGPHVVLLGENGVGKSNLLRGLRLLLDPDLPDSERYLDEDDFWAGGPPFGGTEIVISVDITDYGKDASLLACLGDHEIDAPAGHEEAVARLTYRYGPRETVPETDLPKTGRDEYDFAIYGRDDPSNEVRRDVRRFLMFKLLPALRDAEGDLRAWRRSPLRPLLTGAIPHLDPATLAEASSAIDDATDKIAAEVPLVELTGAIAKHVDELIGKQHHLEPTLGFGSTDPKYLLRSLKLFVDAERAWDVSSTSLGLANVVYLALLLLRVRQQEEASELAAMLLGIEEPEAHLHPQMQRKVFRHLLARDRPVIVSTHSPSIASVASVRSIVLLRTEADTSTLSSLADASGFTEQELTDLARYLDVTRAEMLFGRGVVLIEGDTEKFIVPAAARLGAPPIDLDEYGVSVCSVAGTDFVPYTKLLHHLGIPYAVVTDGDGNDATGEGACPGIDRGLKVLRAVGADTESIERHLKQGDVAVAVTALGALGVFVGRRTLESDAYALGAGARMGAAFKDLRPSTTDATLEVFTAGTALDDAHEAKLIALVERVGKGRFAQRFAEHVVAGDVPAHIRGALEWIVSRVSND